MIGTINLNLPRRWGERRYVCKGWKQYVYHKSSPIVSHESAKKLNQFSNSWNLASSIASKEYHQQRIVAYRASTFSK